MQYQRVLESLRVCEDRRASLTFLTFLLVIGWGVCTRQHINNLSNIKGFWSLWECVRTDERVEPFWHFVVVLGLYTREHINNLWNIKGFWRRVLSSTQQVGHCTHDFWIKTEVQRHAEAIQESGFLPIFFGIHAWFKVYIPKHQHQYITTETLFKT